MSKQLAGIVVALLLGNSWQWLAGAATLQLDAARLFALSVTHDLNLNSQNGQIELDAGELYEDDGPASGHSYKEPENREQLTPEVWIKKELIISNSEAHRAYLVVLSDDPVQAVINGVSGRLGENESGRALYKTYAIEPGLLRQGENQIILRDTGRVSIARADEFALGSRTRTNAMGHSARSSDAGKTWDYHHLGPGGNIDGEYGVRVFLDHYRGEGFLLTPVFDVANLSGDAIGSPVKEVGPIHVSITAKQCPAGRILVRARTGSTYVPSDTLWTGWRELSEAGGLIDKPRGRFLQLTVGLSSTNRLETPQLTTVEVTANPVAPKDWTRRLRLIEEHNEEIVRTSIPFEYEPLDHPRLKQLRAQYHLDQVVQGAHGELELMLRLAQWACNAWDWPEHISEYYPPWDALQILNTYKDGTPTGGFCHQFNVVFLQACESFGIPGRAISISQGRLQQEHPGGGHEIVELWSNEFKKWVYVDGALAWYIVDPQTGVPLSMLELRERQLPTLRGRSVKEVRVVAAERSRNKQFLWNGLAAPKPLNWYLELRMIPRSNFLQQKSPLPLNQGTDEWSWTGHYVWTDSEVPAGLLFGHRVSKHADFEWTLNQAHFVLEPLKKPGTLRVHLDTETPSFQTFLAGIDSNKKKPVAAVFNWVLHPGENRLVVNPLNKAGREGIPSWISLRYTGK